MNKVAAIMNLVVRFTDSRQAEHLQQVAAVARSLFEDLHQDRRQQAVSYLQGVLKARPDASAQKLLDEEEQKAFDKLKTSTSKARGSGGGRGGSFRGRGGRGSWNFDSFKPKGRGRGRGKGKAKAEQDKA
jgi:hypothetical protein